MTAAGDGAKGLATPSPLMYSATVTTNYRRHPNGYHSEISKPRTAISPHQTRKTIKYHE